MRKLVNNRADDGRCELGCPVSMPNASAFLWNRKMLLQLNCRGYAVAQFMQPEPSKYSHAPVLEERTFIQPEQPLYAHHPGRFAYISDVETGELFSVPHEPVRKTADDFCFSAGGADVRWRTRHGDVGIHMSVSLPVDDVAELWSFEIINYGNRPRQLRFFPCFTIGYMSWMNQSACYRADLGGIVARSVTPYQKIEDYEHIRSLHDWTVLLHDHEPDAWETCRDTFEGEGGIQNPDSIRAGKLGNGDALYEVPIAALQYNIELAAADSRRFKFVFAPARNDASVRTLRQRFLNQNGFDTSFKEYAAYLERGRGCLQIQTPDVDLDRFVNHWLARQVYYHGSTNRLTTDPQTRNFLQDSMGMVYIQPDIMRDTIRRALGQQKQDGSMPDGIVAPDGGGLKYINQIPHTDHCVWLPVCLEAYLDETADFSFLDEIVPGISDQASLSVFDRVANAMRWLINNRDNRGLSFIAQGDWCDPMNMVGHKGRGVSGWLTIATAHSLRLWSAIARSTGREAIATELAAAADQFADASQKHLWDGNWFARGISDDGTVFGVSEDVEGKIYVNPQSWAVMSGIASLEQRSKIYAAIDEHLDTPFGAAMLAPAYTGMRENIGRVTQKHPGSAENGAVYNHASTFYIYSLFLSGRSGQAYRELRKMLPGPADEDYVQRGQMPVFVPNYYRGAARQFPRTAGRSSQMFNTGAASWLYRIIVEQLFGLKGSPEGLSIEPALPPEWTEASAIRRFRGATIEVDIRRIPNCERLLMTVDGKRWPDTVLRDIVAGRTYKVEVKIPEHCA